MGYLEAFLNPLAPRWSVQNIFLC